MIVAVLVALASAASFALGSALQHRAAGRRDPNEEPAHGMIARLVRRRSWLAGLGLSGVAFTLHGVALSKGDLGLVQPVIVSGIVFAVLIRAALDHHRPGRWVITWLIVTWAGLAVVIAVRAGRSAPATGVHHQVPYLVGGLALAGATVAFSRIGSERRRGLLLGAAAGILFGLVAGLLKVVTGQLAGGPLDVVTHWPLWALAVVGVAAILLNQRAYQRARLSVTAPALNIAQVLVAVGFGAVVFGERLDHSPLLVAAEVGGLALVVLGVWRLAEQE